MANGKRRRVHPSPHSAQPSEALAALPVAVMALAAALSAEEQEVVAYLLSDGGGGRRRKQLRGAHPPEIGCGCFGCYKSFWERWDASPNRHVIHRIIEAFEEDSLESGGGGGRREDDEMADAAAAAPDEGFLVMDGGHVACSDGLEGGGGGCKGSVGKIVSFIGERVWWVWK